MDNVSKPSADQSMAQKLAQLWEVVKPVVLGQVDIIDNAVKAAVNGSLEDEERRRAEDEAHKLAGSVGSFGFDGGSRVARQIELILKAEAPMSRAQELSQLVAELRLEVSAEFKT